MAEEAPPNSSPPPVSGDSSVESQAMGTAGLHRSSHTTPQMFPPVFSSSTGAPSQNQEQNNHGQGLYAVQFSPLMGMMPELSQNVLIPLTYKIPTRTNSTGGEGQEQGQDAVRQQHGPQRQVVVRRFQFAFHLDVALLIKLAFAVILFGQEGSRQRFFVLVFFASLIYLYQTGVMTPFIRYLQRGLIPPRPAARQPNAAAQQNAPAQQNVPGAQNDGNDRQPGIPDNAGNENQNQPAAEVAADNNINNQAEGQPEQVNRVNLWGIVREIQTFVVGFITSLLPGFDHND